MVEMIFFIDDESSGYKAPNISIAMIDISGVFFHVLGAMADCAVGEARVGFFCRTRESVRQAVLVGFWGMEMMQCLLRSSSFVTNRDPLSSHQTV
jgi:hypothetical protein